MLIRYKEVTIIARTFYVEASIPFEVATLMLLPYLVLLKKETVFCCHSPSCSDIMQSKVLAMSLLHGESNIAIT